MYTIVSVSVVAVLLALMANAKSSKNGLEWSFALLTVFLCIRYDFGNDYHVAFDTFLYYKDSGVSLFDFDKYGLLREKGEVVWVFINLLFRRLGFFSLIICITLFENFVLYKLVKQYVAKEWYWLSIFIFTFNGTLMLIGASMMRQWLALCIFVYSVRFIQSGKPLPYFILLLLATQIHSSAWVLLPMYFVRYFPSQVNKKFLLFAVPLYIVWIYVFPKYLGNNIEFLLQSQEMNKYGVYLVNSNNNIGSITSFIARAFFPIICITQINRVDEKKKLLFLIFSFYLLILPVSERMPMIGRIGTYFFVFFLCVFPETLSFLKKNNNIIYIPILIFYIFWTLYNYFPFYSSETFGEFYQEYKTIFGQPWM